MAMFCDFFGSKTLFSFSTGGSIDFLVVSFLSLEFALKPNRLSIISSFIWKELDSWSQTVVLSEVAFTLSQCRGLNFGLLSSMSSPLGLPEELHTLSEVAFTVTFLEPSLKSGVGSCGFGGT
uniref:Uncharacterized protein n=1 Tax=Opuntia streptacantha TaxID=393608 RepID=A0A7C9E8L9_OPUST